MRKTYFFFAFFLFSFCTLAQTKKRFFVDLTTAIYIPNLTYKIDFNAGLSLKKKNENMFSVGFNVYHINSFLYDIKEGISFNVKDVFISKQKIYKNIKPLFLIQFKYNNPLIYNTIEPNAGNNILLFKNSLISQIGIQISDTKGGFRIQIQTGVSYNFTKIPEIKEQISPKTGKDIYFNFVNSISIVKAF